MQKAIRGLMLLGITVFAISLLAADQTEKTTFQEPETYEAVRRLAQKTAGYKNLQKIGLAMHNYHDLFGQFPSAVVYASDGKTQHSWRVELLPLLRELVDGAAPFRLKYMDRELYNAAIKECGYDINQPWDSPVNLTVLKTMPPVYHHPSDKPDSTESAYYAVVGKGTAFAPGEVISYTDIKEWPASTLMLAESRSKSPWTKPVDIAYSEDATVPRFGGFTAHGYLVLSCDGGVHFISDSVSPENLRSFISRDQSDTFEIPGVPYRY
ncbi:DUF1559 family PulG-like putative transporter [Gimesia maris]|uniref:DUF1559 domain-containing protein n=2 Tax=Gimesia maris TaxID=122 RepID=A0ABX5YGM3_9PLAN|nr:DUF1559 domain-containing protein [Gimesia maris]QDU12812.1 hypothetical protein CA11_05920 [Gimesia maris]QEG14743.1 hypothetical protein GmarT_05790 [Gimesia maris]QGQ31862.1 DUF1559 domain-containing protein [Gimesia maris]